MLVAKANALWHTDSSFKKTLALASVLTARVLPGEDGDTEFTSTRLAWDRLPADREGSIALPPVRWRLNWRNPANDCRALYVDDPHHHLGDRSDGLAEVRPPVAH